MPTYEYRREDGTTFETFQSISDEPLTIDPETGQQVQRVISGGVGLQFKGSGFYLTDYARKNGSTESSTNSSESSEATSSEASTPSETTTESSSKTATSD